QVRRERRRIHSVEVDQDNDPCPLFGSEHYERAGSLLSAAMADIRHACRISHAPSQSIATVPFVSHLARHPVLGRPHGCARGMLYELVGKNRHLEAGHVISRRKPASAWNLVAGIKKLGVLNLA